jgi:hypothetical protein
MAMARRPPASSPPFRHPPAAAADPLDFARNEIPLVG